METDRFELFREWTKNWDDLIQFEIMEIGEKPKNINAKTIDPKAAVPAE